jgi:hypothetical protein
MSVVLTVLLEWGNHIGLPLRFMRLMPGVGPVQCGARTVWGNHIGLPLHLTRLTSISKREEHD